VSLPTVWKLMGDCWPPVDDTQRVLVLVFMYRQNSGPHACRLGFSGVGRPQQPCRIKPAEGKSVQPCVTDVNLNLIEDTKICGISVQAT
jgi:hypothetical protein